MLGAAFYRSTLLGIALVPFAITMIATFDVANGGRSLGPVASLLAAFGVDHGLGRTLTGTAIVVIVAAAAVWLLVRNLPVRTGGR